MRQDDLLRLGGVGIESVLVQPRFQGLDRVLREVPPALDPDGVGLLGRAVRGAVQEVLSLLLRRGLVLLRAARRLESVVV